MTAGEPAITFAGGGCNAHLDLRAQMCKCVTGWDHRVQYKRGVPC